MTWKAAFGLLLTTVSSQAMAQAQTAADSQLEEIVVTGQRAALASAIEEERKADTVTNVITADDVGQFGDQNSAEALARLPGITIDRAEGEGRSVSLRGLPSSFTQVTVNGARVGTSDAGSSTANLDIIPTDLLGQIVVNKSTTPDLDGDTIGGSVELQSLSAFQPKRDMTVTARVEGSYNDYAGKWGPKGSVSATKRFAQDTIGVALSLSYFKRKVEGDDLRNEDGLLFITRNDPATGTPTRYNYPTEVNQRFEVGDRERFGATLNLEFRPSEGQEFWLRGQFSTLKDNDIRIQSQWQTARATGSEVQQISDTAGQFIDVRKRNQIFFQPTKDRLWTVSLGHRNQLGDWNVSSQADWSRSRWSQEDGVRGRFEIDDIGQRIEWSETGAFTEAFRDRTRPDPAVLANYRFSNLLFIEEERDDQIYSLKTDIQRDFGETSVKFGVKYRDREKSADKTEYNGNPSSVGLGTQTLANFSPLSQTPRFETFGPFPSLEEANTLFYNARDLLLAVPTFLRRDNSVASDYEINEDVLAGYAMATVQLSPAIKVIGGARIEKTYFDSTGYFFESNDDGIDAGGAPVTPELLPAVKRSYTDVLPSLLVRYEPTATILGRLSYSRGVKRPDFDEARNRIEVRFNPSDPSSIRRMVAGNPNLKALSAHQFDASLGWYPNRNTALSVALFHKDISDFFVEFLTNDITQTPIQLPAGVGTNFGSIITTLNGAKARVTGAEFSATHNLTYLPGLLSGLFFTGNITLATSKAEILQRPGEKFAFPGQADFTANVSGGWENDLLSVRYSVTHTGERLAGIGNELALDRYRKPYTQHDINVRVNITDQFQIYADAINIFEEKNSAYWQGVRTGVFEQIEDFGATYQVGIRAKF